MKTTSEKNYIDIVISMIMTNRESIKKKEEALKIFFRNQSYSYDELCDNIYMLLMMKGTNVLTIDNYGNSYINLNERCENKKYYDVLVLNEFSQNCNDLIALVDIALDHLKEQVHNEIYNEMKKSNISEIDGEGQIQYDCFV